MVKVGQRVRFNPFYEIKGIGINNCDTVDGTVVAIYERNKWFSVEWGEHKLRTSFQFCDIGRDVKIIG